MNTETSEEFVAAFPKRLENYKKSQERLLKIHCVILVLSIVATAAVILCGY